jgi:hypothetical protein
LDQSCVIAACTAALSLAMPVANEAMRLRLDSSIQGMLFAHLQRALKLDRLRLRAPNGARDEFTLAATAQNLRCAPVSPW